MNKLVSLVFLTFLLGYATMAQNEDKSKRLSPPASVSEVVASGARITIDYSQPSVKGRTIGKNLEPKEESVWRAGANEATVFETSKDIKINGQTLAAGKYGLFMISGKDEWTIIFNKTWKQWGAFDYKSADDALRIAIKPQKAPAFSEKMTFTIDKSGTVNLYWGNILVSFPIK